MNKGESDVCREKLGDGEGCGEVQDCISGRCEKEGGGWFAKKMCMLQMDAGEECNDDNDCISNRCESDLCT